MPSLIKESKCQKGQVLLIVVLIMIIALTVGLSLASRTITSLRTSTEEAASQRALAAAEAGIEQALRSGLSISGSFGVGTTYQTEVTTVRGGQIFLNGGNPVLKDDGVDLWLSDYSVNQEELYLNPISGNLTVYWGDPRIEDDCSSAAIEIIIVVNKDNPRLSRYAYDGCSSRRGENQFRSALPGGQIVFNERTVSYKYRSEIIGINNAIIARITPIYFDTVVGAAAPNSAFPSQGTLVTSTGTDENEGTRRSIQVFQGYPKIPSEFFTYTIFSP